MPIRIKLPESYGRNVQVELDQSTPATVVKEILNSYGDVDPGSVDMSDAYNTPIPKELYKEYRAWTAEVDKMRASVGRKSSILDDQRDYDIRGYWLDKHNRGEKPSIDPVAHTTDRYKKPNHPTFSAESIYHRSDGWSGGEWLDDWTFTPGQGSLYNPDQIQRILAEDAKREGRKTPEGVDWVDKSGKKVPAKMVTVLDDTQIGDWAAQKAAKENRGEALGLAAMAATAPFTAGMSIPAQMAWSTGAYMTGKQANKAIGTALGEDKATWSALPGELAENALRGVEMEVGGRLLAPVMGKVGDAKDAVVNYLTKDRGGRVLYPEGAGGPASQGYRGTRVREPYGKMVERVAEKGKKSWGQDVTEAPEWNLNLETANPEPGSYTPPPNYKDMGRSGSSAPGGTIGGMVGDVYGQGARAMGRPPTQPYRPKPPSGPEGGGPYGGGGGGEGIPESAPMSEVQNYMSQGNPNAVPKWYEPKSSGEYAAMDWTNPSSAAPTGNALMTPMRDYMIPDPIEVTPYQLQATGTEGPVPGPGPVSQAAPKWTGKPRKVVSVPKGGEGGGVGTGVVEPQPNPRQLPEAAPEPPSAPGTPTTTPTPTEDEIVDVVFRELNKNVPAKFDMANAGNELTTDAERVVLNSLGKYARSHGLLDEALVKVQQRYAWFARNSKNPWEKAQAEYLLESIDWGSIKGKLRAYQGLPAHRTRDELIEAADALGVLHRTHNRHKFWEGLAEEEKNLVPELMPGYLREDYKPGGSYMPDMEKLLPEPPPPKYPVKDSTKAAKKYIRRHEPIIDRESAERVYYNHPGYIQFPNAQDWALSAKGAGLDPVIVYDRSTDLFRVAAREASEPKLVPFDQGVMGNRELWKPYMREVGDIPPGGRNRRKVTGYRNAQEYLESVNSMNQRLEEARSGTPGAKPKPEKEQLTPYEQSMKEAKPHFVGRVYGGLGPALKQARGIQDGYGVELAVVRDMGDGGLFKIVPKTRADMEITDPRSRVKGGGYVPRVVNEEMDSGYRAPTNVKDRIMERINRLYEEE